ACKLLPAEERQGNQAAAEEEHGNRLGSSGGHGGVAVGDRHRSIAHAVAKSTGIDKRRSVDHAAVRQSGFSIGGRLNERSAGKSATGGVGESRTGRRQVADREYGYASRQIHGAGERAGVSGGPSGRSRESEAGRVVVGVIRRPVAFGVVRQN